MVEKEEKVNKDKGGFEVYMTERIVNGNLSLKKGSYSTFVEVSKILSWDEGKPSWANLRFEKQDILLLRNFLNKSVEFLEKNVDDPFGLEALKSEIGKGK